MTTRVVWGAAAAAIGCLWLVGCDDGGMATDAGSGRDSGARSDAGPGGADAGGGDAGSMDAGAAGSDAGMADAGPPLPDAGPPGPSSERQTARPLGSTAAGNGFYEYLPPLYGDGTLRPLLVFWHGIGENGNGDSELNRVLRNGPPRIIDRDNWPADRPFVVLSPQHAGGGCPGAGEIHSFIDFAMSEYDVDPSRIYLTGLSCGAIGSWGYLGQYLDEQVTAAVLIAGDGRGAWNAQMCELGRVAIWGFHGDADGTVSPQGTIVPTTNLMGCPSPPRRDLQVTIYPGVGHDSWSRTYDLSAGHDIYAWLLTQHAP
ncbi:MAG: hypothetical protein AB7S26_30030 [Sandaracinaceae bacterium]